MYFFTFSFQILAQCPKPCTFTMCNNKETKFCLYKLQTDDWLDTVCLFGAILSLRQTWNIQNLGLKVAADVIGGVLTKTVVYTQNNVNIYCIYSTNYAVHHMIKWLKIGLPYYNCMMSISNRGILHCSLLETFASVNITGRSRGLCGQVSHICTLCVVRIPGEGAGWRGEGSHSSFSHPHPLSSSWKERKMSSTTCTRPERNVRVCLRICRSRSGGGRISHMCERFLRCSSHPFSDGSSGHI